MRKIAESYTAYLCKDLKEKCGLDVRMSMFHASGTSMFVSYNGDLYEVRIEPGASGGSTVGVNTGSLALLSHIESSGLFNQTKQGNGSFTGSYAPDFGITQAPTRQSYTITVVHWKSSPYKSFFEQQMLPKKQDETVQLPQEPKTSGNWYKKLKLSFVKVASEYWINEEGQEFFADGDVGDYNHEAYVTEQLVAQYSLPFDPHSAQERDWVNWIVGNIDQVITHSQQNHMWNPDFTKEIQQLRQQNNLQSIARVLFGDGMVDDQTLYDCYNVPDNVRSVLNGNVDGRDYAIKNWNWKRVRGNNVDTWKLTPADIDIIIKGMEGIHSDVEDDEAFNSIELNVNVVSTNQVYWNTTIGDLRNMKGFSANQFNALPDYKRVEKTPAYYNGRQGD